MWLLFCQRTKQSDSSVAGMCVHDSELDVAKHFTHLSAKEFEQLSRLNGDVLVRIGMTIAAGSERSLNFLQNPCECRLLGRKRCQASS